MSVSGYNEYMKMFTTSLLLLYVFITQSGYSRELFFKQSFGKNSAVLLADAQGEIIYQWQIDKMLMPASTLKILTAQLSLDKWGAEHRFATDFYWLDGWLWVKGYGDPYLIAEELDRVVRVLQPKLAKLLTDGVLRGIAIDGSYFAETQIDGRTTVNDPYNAPLSAVAANFNTVYITKQGAQIRSAEAQTPLTETAKLLAQPLSNGKHRVNVGSAQIGQQQFAQILRAKLLQKKEDATLPHFDVASAMRFASTPASAQLLYRHYNSHSLATLLRGTLTYSNNFIANQLFVLLAESEELSTLDVRLAKQALQQQLGQRYGVGVSASNIEGEMLDWSSVLLEEGAGLSRKNRLSARHLWQVLHDFAPHKGLLKSYHAGQVRAKTGTLQGVRSYAGYITVDSLLYYFVFLFNEPVPYRYREQLLQTTLNKLKQRP